MFIITEWLERYEVNDKGQPAKAGDKLRKSKLEYIRSKIHGRAQSAGFAAMQYIAGQYAYETFGLFLKFLEIMGAEKSENRQGPLLNAQGQPATLEDLAFICRFPIERVEFALQVLCHHKVRWMMKINNIEDKQEIPEIPGKSGPFLNTTQLNTTQHNTNNTHPPRARGGSSTPTNSVGDSRTQYAIEDVENACILMGIPKSKAQSYFDQYESQGWNKGNGQPITNLAAHMAKRWDSESGSWDFDKKREAEKRNKTIADKVAELKREGKI